VPGKEGEWPGMRLMIHKGGILDELQRKFLPEEFRNFAARTAAVCLTGINRTARSPQRRGVKNNSSI